MQKKSHDKTHAPTSNSVMQLEKVCLLHNSQELLLIHFTITVSISFIYHFLKLFVCHALTKFFGDPFQILKRYFPCFVIIEQTESLQDLILGITIEDLMRHHFKKLFVSDCTTSIVVNIRDHFLNLFFLRLEAKCTHRNFELL